MWKLTNKKIEVKKNIVKERNLKSKKLLLLNSLFLFQPDLDLSESYIVYCCNKKKEIGYEITEKLA